MQLRYGTKNLKQYLNIKHIKQVHWLQYLNVSQPLFVVIPLLTPCYSYAEYSGENSNPGKGIFSSIWGDKMQHKQGG